MLANGIKLGYKTTSSGSTYTNLEGLKEVPELGAQPERVDNSALGDAQRRYELGMDDPGELNYVFRFENGSSTSSYRVLKALSGVNYFEQEFPDGTKVQFEAESSVRIGGGSVNSPVEFTLTLAVQSAFTVVNPTTSGSGTGG